MKTLTSNISRFRALTLGACLAGAIAFAGCDSGPEYANGPDGSAVNDTGCMRRNNFLERLLTECVTIAGVNEHLAAIQGFADDNDGNRVDGSAGFDATADYVAATLEAAGYAVTRRPIPTYQRIEGSLRQFLPTVMVYETGVFTGSGLGDVTANVTAVDINLVPPRTTTSGCEAADFAGFPAGNIALIQRGGGCTFAVKAENAQAAGASAVIIFNQGDNATRLDLIVGTLAPSVLGIPVVGASFADGASLAQPDVVAQVSAISVPVNSESIFAERIGPSGQVVIAGAALDSGGDTPGLNTNGSGTAALLEVAENLANTRLDHTVRFAWWGGHFVGLLGAEDYLASLPQSDLDAIALYLDFDAIGSPNYVRFVLDSDGSDGGIGFPASAPVEQAFHDFYASRGLAAATLASNANSEWGTFALYSIPFGAIHTGAVGVKTAAEAATYGGTAGAQYDPCYLQACDTIANVNRGVLDVNADAAAAVILHFGTVAELPARGANTSNAHGSPVLAAAE